MRNGDNDYLETNVDKLYNIVKKNGKVKMSEAVKLMNVDNALIEEWAKILEDHGLIKIYYPIIGEPELRLIKKSGEENEDKEY